MAETEACTMPVEESKNEEKTVPKRKRALDDKSSEMDTSESEPKKPNLPAISADKLSVGDTWF